MSAAKKTGLKWPVCTVLILALLGGMIYWGYTAFQAEQAMMQANATAPAPKAPGAAPGANAPSVSYRSLLPPYFLVGFAIVMAAILGSIIYFWWSLKDMEGGRRYGDEKEEVSSTDSEEVSSP
ncbi:MAG: hypothetical protein OXL41_02950 [Nitrospinae bacterium]|nr:hypothetical protein [Nitrospinota bacterium]